MELSALCLYLDKLLNPENKITDVCPNGLQVEGKPQVKKVATAVSASLATIASAVEKGVDALIVHHGLFWQKDSYVIQGVKKEKIELLLRYQLSLIAYHLPLDMHLQLGNNWRAAQEMGWTKLEPFLWMNGAYIGVKGKVKPASAEHFKSQLEEYYQHPATCALGGPAEIKHVGLISGGAYKSLQTAAQEGLDAFVTGSFDEPAWHQAFEEKIHFFALGHSATERVGPRALSRHLAQDLALECEFIDLVNPF